MAIPSQHLYLELFLSTLELELQRNSKLVDQTLTSEFVELCGREVPIVALWQA